MFRTSLIRRPAAATQYPDPFGRFFDRFFDADYFRPTALSGGTAGELTDPAWIPSVDSRQTNEAYIVEVDLPGVDKEDVHVNVENNVLTLSGERTFAKDEEAEGYDRIERAYGKFSRAFTLPSHVDTEKVNATFKSGVLTVTLPKVEQAKPRQIEIK